MKSRSDEEERWRINDLPAKTPKVSEKQYQAYRQELSDEFEREFDPLIKLPESEGGQPADNPDWGGRGIFAS